MKIKGMVAGVLAAGGVVFALQGGCLNQSSSDADQRVAKRMGDICSIARDNVKTPEKGVRKLGAYLDKNIEKMFADYAAMFATIERISDDKKHDDRARLTRDRLRKADCPKDIQRFADAVSEDPAASALVQRFGERLGRTLEIINGERQHVERQHVELLGVPPQLQTLLR
jgi:hypothetical protein